MAVSAGALAGDRAVGRVGRAGQRVRSRSSATVTRRCTNRRRSGRGRRAAQRGRVSSMLMPLDRRARGVVGVVGRRAGDRLVARTRRQGRRSREGLDARCRRRRYERDRDVGVVPAVGVRRRGAGAGDRRAPFCPASPAADLVPVLPTLSVTVVFFVTVRISGHRVRGRADGLDSRTADVGAGPGHRHVGLIPARAIRWRAAPWPARGRAPCCQACRRQTGGPKSPRRCRALTVAVDPFHAFVGIGDDAAARSRRSAMEYVGPTNVQTHWGSCPRSVWRSCARAVDDIDALRIGVRVDGQGQAPRPASHAPSRSRR